MIRSGIQHLPLTNVKKVAKNTENNKYIATLLNQDGSYQELEVDAVLEAVGRIPDIESLGLSNTDIQIKGGLIGVDENHYTNVPGVYSIGDVAAPLQLTPTAIRAGRILSERLFNNGLDIKMDYTNVPSVIFSHPPYGVIGLSEE